jgi:hypothetical protein
MLTVKSDVTIGCYTVIGNCYVLRNAEHNPRCHHKCKYLKVSRRSSLPTSGIPKKCQGGKGGNKFIYPLEGGVIGFGIITVIQNLFSDIFCCHA